MNPFTLTYGGPFLAHQGSLFSFRSLVTVPGWTQRSYIAVHTGPIRIRQRYFTQVVVFPNRIKSIHHVLNVLVYDAHCLIFLSWIRYDLAAGPNPSVQMKEDNRCLFVPIQLEQGCLKFKFGFGPLLEWMYFDQELLVVVEVHHIGSIVDTDVLLMD